MASNFNTNSVRNRSSEDRSNEYLRKLPFAIRRYYKRNSTINGPDEIYENRETDSFLQKFETVTYPVSDSTFGSPNERIANIYFNHLTDKPLQSLIKNYLDEKRWIYHPIRDFEDWRDIAHRFYGDEELFWGIIVFNNITDPFQALKDLNVIRIPEESFIYRIQYRYYFNYSGAKNIDIQA